MTFAAFNLNTYIVIRLKKLNTSTEHTESIFCFLKFEWIFFYLCSLSVLIYVLIQFRYPLQCCRFDVSFQIAETPLPRKPARFAPPRVRRKSVISTPLYVQCDQVQSALSSGTPRSVVLLEKMSGDLRRKKNPIRRSSWKLWWYYEQQVLRCTYSFALGKYSSDVSLINLPCKILPVKYIYRKFTKKFTIYMFFTALTVEWPLYLYMFLYFLLRY